MKNSTRILSVFVLLLLGAFGWAVYLMFTPHVSDRVSRDYDDYVAQFGPTDLPRSATNIRYVASSVGMGGRAHVCRFEAPIDDAKLYAMTEFAYYDSDREKPSQPPEFTAVSSHPEKPDLSVYGIRDLSWFDTEDIEKGITLARDHAHRPFICIDLTRNIYYSFWTD